MTVLYDSLLSSSSGDKSRMIEHDSDERRRFLPLDLASSGHRRCRVGSPKVTALTVLQLIVIAT
jgi:hypothetical protein